MYKELLEKVQRLQNQKIRFLNRNELHLWKGQKHLNKAIIKLWKLEKEMKNNVRN